MKARRMLRRLAPWLMATSLLACKRSNAPALEEVWDENPGSADTEAVEALSPPWTKPTRAQLDDGLVAYWLHEPDAPVAHVRLLLPRSADVDPGAGRIVVEGLASALQRLTGRLGGEVEVEDAPGRFELVLALPEEHLDRGVQALARTLAADRPAPVLASGKRELIADLSAPSTRDRAVALLVSRLLEGDAPELLDPARLERLGERELEDAWESLVMPTTSVLIVHSGRTAQQGRQTLDVLSEAWKGPRLRKRGPASGVERLRNARAASRGAGRPMGDPPAPLFLVEGASRGKPVVLLGRTIATRTPSERAMARIAHRMLQEETEASLSIAGDLAVLAIALPVSASDPDDGLEKELQALHELAQDRPQRQRVFQAARLWLGARMVQASLEGEDWTALWSESMDLADDDGDIARALAREASLMLDTNPETLAAWTRTWLDPVEGRGGWVWVGAGIEGRTERRLSRGVEVRKR